MHNRPGAKAAPKPAHSLHRAPLLPTKATDVVVVPPPPPPPPVVVSWADRAKRAAQTAAQPNTVEDTAVAATSSAPRVNPLAHRLALGKKLKRDDLAGLSERDKDALRLYRSLQYRSTEAYKEKQHAQEELRRLKTVERWGKEAIEGPLKPSAVVHVADHLEALTAAGASSGQRTRTAPSAALPHKPFTFAARGVPLPMAPPPSAAPTETSSVLPTTAVWGKRPTVGHAVKTDAAPSLATSLPVPILPDSSGVTIVKRSRKATSAAIAPVAAPVAAKSRAGNNKVLSSARAKTASALGGVPRHKERLFRRLKKLTRLKQSILQTRRAALVKAAEAVGIVATKTSPKANIERKVEKESEGTADATQTPLGGIATVDEKKQRGSKVRHFDVEGKASAAAKVLLHQLEAVEAIADLQVQARAAYDDREKTLLDKRKHQYAAAVAKLRRQGSHAVRRAVDGAPQEPQSQQDDRADVVDAVANREDEEDPDEAGEPGDAMTTEVVKPLSDLQHAIARAGSYPVMHLLTGAGSHPAPWLVDLRFVPQQQQPSTQAEKKKKNATTLQPHAEGETDGPSTPPQQHEAAKPTQKGRAPVDLATFRDGLTWAHRPHWWPPARMVRAYVTNTLTRELDKACEVLFDKLRVLQQKLKATQPLKYPKHMRYVLGLREAERGLRAKRVRLVVIAPDVEAVDVLDASIVRIVDMCTANNIPHFFALSRGALGRVFKQFNNRVSLVAMYSAEGAYEECREAVRLGREAKQAFVELRLDPQRSEATSTRDLKESANASSP